MSADLVRKLSALGLNLEQVAGVMEIFDAASEERKSKARERVQRWRDKRRNVTETPRNVTVGLTRVEDSSSKKDISGKKEEKKESAPAARSDLADFKAELSSILDTERVEALVAVRRKRGATMTANTGRLLVAAIQRCPQPPAVIADEMALRNWTSVKPDWLEKRSTGPPRKPNPFEAYQQIANERGWNEPEILPGNHGDAERLSSEQRGLAGPVVDV